MQNIIITAPSLDPMQNVNGVSSVVRLIIDNNPNYKYLHFELGKNDKEKGGWHRIAKLIGSFFNGQNLLIHILMRVYTIIFHLMRNQSSVTYHLCIMSCIKNISW